jgi:hypothetical protein
MPNSQNPDRTNDRLISMRQLADRWGLKTTYGALGRLDKSGIPVLLLNGKRCSVYLSDILAFEQQKAVVGPTARRAQARERRKLRDARRARSTKQAINSM